MANTTINLSGINFIVATGGYTHQGWDKKYTNVNNLLDGVYDPDTLNIEKSINAIEIDWNGADFNSASGNVNPGTINTTGDLIKAIKWASTLGGSEVSINLNGENYSNANFYAPTLPGNDGEVLVSKGSGRSPIWESLQSYTLPAATLNALGGIKLGYSDSIASSKNYAVTLDPNNKAYVNVPWTDTTNITASINDADKKLLVSDDNGQKFQIKLSLVLIDLSNPNSEKIAALEITAGGDTINTILPGIKIDEQNRKMYWIGADGQQSSKSLQFGSLDIIAVFLNTLSYDSTNNRYWATMYFDGTIPSSGNYFDEVVYIGDLILALNSTDSKYHLYACYETTYDEGGNQGSANAFFVDLGVFPGDNISLSADDITVSVDSQTIGINNIRNVLEALNSLLYYVVVNPSDVATLSD